MKLLKEETNRFFPCQKLEQYIENNYSDTSNIRYQKYGHSLFLAKSIGMKYQ